MSGVRHGQHFSFIRQVSQAVDHRPDGPQHGHLRSLPGNRADLNETILKWINPPAAAMLSPASTTSISIVKTSTTFGSSDRPPTRTSSRSRPAHRIRERAAQEDAGKARRRAAEEVRRDRHAAAVSGSTGQCPQFLRYRHQGRGARRFRDLACRGRSARHQHHPRRAATAHRRRYPSLRHPQQFSGSGRGRSPDAAASGAEGPRHQPHRVPQHASQGANRRISGPHRQAGRDGASSLHLQTQHLQAVDPLTTAGAARPAAADAAQLYDYYSDVRTEPTPPCSRFPSAHRRPGRRA